MKSLKSRLFVATTADIEVLTREYLAGVSAAEISRGTYLTAVIATTQDEVGATPRERAGKPAKLTADEIAADISAFRAVHKRFFAVVRSVAKEEGFKGPELDRKVKKFCSAASTFKSFIKAGGDLRALVAERETKHSLRKATNPAAESKPHRFGRAVTRYANRMDKLARDAAKVNIEETLEAIKGLRTHLEQLAADLTTRRTKNAEKAVRKSHKSSTFIPQQHPARTQHSDFAT